MVVPTVLKISRKSDRKSFNMNFKNLLCRNKFLLLEDLLKVHFQESSEKINLCSNYVQNRAALVTVPVGQILNDF